MLQKRATQKKKEKINGLMIKEVKKITITNVQKRISEKLLRDKKRKYNQIILKKIEETNINK